MSDKYSGKAKDVIILEDDQVRIVFRNSISAFDGVKLDELEGKGSANCRISTKLFEILEHYGIETHYLSKEKENVLICKKVEIVPVEAVCRNITAGSFCRRYGVEEGIVLPTPVVEFFYKNDELHDPLVTKEVAIKLGWMTEKEAILMEAITRVVNHVLSKIFEMMNLQLVDFKLEFGRTKEGRLILADEISADTMRLWEKETGEIMDKDRYRKDLGNVVEHYSNIAKRLENIAYLPELSFNTIISVTVELKESVLDPAGEITHRSLDRLGYKGIEKVRLGKNAKLTFSIPPTSSLYEKAEEISNKILSNPLIESYSIDIKFEGK